MRRTLSLPALLSLAVLGLLWATPQVWARPGKELRAVERIDLDGEILAWGGLRLGMNVVEVEKVLGDSLPVPEVPRTDLGCAAEYGTTVRHRGMSLGLAFDLPGRRG